MLRKHGWQIGDKEIAGDQDEFDQDAHQEKPDVARSRHQVVEPPRIAVPLVDHDLPDGPHSIEIEEHEDHNEDLGSKKEHTTPMLVVK